MLYPPLCRCDGDAGHDLADQRRRRRFTSTVSTTPRATRICPPARTRRDLFGVDAHVPGRRRRRDPDAAAWRRRSLRSRSRARGRRRDRHARTARRVDADARSPVRARSLAYRGLPVELAPTTTAATARSGRRAARRRAARRLQDGRCAARRGAAARASARDAEDRARARAPSRSRRVRLLKAAVSAELADGFVSTDDALSARAASAARGAPRTVRPAVDSDEATTCSRNTNIRADRAARRRLLRQRRHAGGASRRPGAARDAPRRWRRPRSDLVAPRRKRSPRGRRGLRRSAARCATRQRLDAHALTFIVSSELGGGCRLGGALIRFVPIVAALVPCSTPTASTCTRPGRTTPSSSLCGWSPRRERVIDSKYVVAHRR